MQNTKGISGMPMIMEAINSMSQEEKLHAMDLLWTSIMSSSSGYEPPSWHSDLLKERKRQAESGEAEFIPWSEAKRQLQSEFS